MKRKSIRKRLLDTLFEGVFADILRIRQTPSDLLVEAGGWWTFKVAEASAEDIGFYDEIVADDNLWSAFDEGYMQARFKIYPPMTVFEAHPDLSAEEALELASCGEMVAQNLRTLEARFAAGNKGVGNDRDLNEVFGAWNNATDRNLDRNLNRRRAMRGESRVWLRLQPLPWLGLAALTPLISGMLPGGTEPHLIAVFIACGAVAALTIQELISHFCHREAVMKLEKSQVRYGENALKLSRKIGFDAAMRHQRLVGLRQKASERISQILAERRERPDARPWIKVMLRWFAIHAYLNARIENLRECLVIRLWYHTTLHRGHGTWSSYLDAFINQNDPRRAGDSYLPPMPRQLTRTAWWLAVAVGAGLILTHCVAPNVSLDWAAGGTWGLAAASGFGISVLTTWWRIVRIETAARSDAGFVKVTTNEACHGDIRRDIAGTYERSVAELAELLAKWTQPERGSHYRR